MRTWASKDLQGKGGKLSEIDLAPITAYCKSLNSARKISFLLKGIRQKILKYVCLFIQRSKGPKIFTATLFEFFFYLSLSLSLFLSLLSKWVLITLQKLNNSLAWLA